MKVGYNSQTQDMVIAYPLHGSLYLNITNRCPNACIFCIRNSDNGVGYNLWLEHEPTVSEILAAIGDIKRYREIVFCGYGEPLMRPEVVVAVCTALKKQNQPHSTLIRINTNGLADLFLGYEILPQLKGLVDVISISLNAHNAKEYHRFTQSKYGEEAFDAVLGFARRSCQYIPKVILSVVKYPGVDIEKTAKIAADLGVEFRVREYQPG